MAETLETRQKVQRSLEDIHNSLVAVSQKIAQLELDLGEASEMRSQLDDSMNKLGPLIDSVQTLEAGYETETNRLRNEGELG